MAEKRQTLLIVDDEPTNIRVLRELLKADYTVLAAANGEKALQIVESDDLPDLVLLDIILPGIDGYDVCKKLKADERYKFIPVIFITSQSTEQDEVKGFNAGAVDYITKPFSAPVVKARVKTHLEVKELRGHFKKLSLRDGLTGISNRACFDNCLEQEWKRMQREKAPLSLIFCDVDFFKKYNDYYGHQEGDKCLREVASIIKINANRPADLVARYGGEEFTVILPNTDSEGAVEVAENIRLAIQKREIPHAASTVSKFVSLSLGVATVIPSHEITQKQFIVSADSALYKAKQNGRNRIEMN